MSLRDDSSYRRKVGKAAQRLRGAIRRMIVTASANALWTLAGADDENEPNVEVFGGIGFYSRPPDDGSPEVIMLKVGAATSHPVIVAARDEKTRQLLTAIRDLAKDESAMFTSQARVHIKADGTVEVDDGSGAVELALKSDVDAIETFQKKHFDTGLGHTHAGLGTPPIVGTGTTGAGFSVPSATGTTVLKGK